MTITEKSRAVVLGGTVTWQIADLFRSLVSSPAALLVQLSAIFGLMIILINPPLRGPDEAAHFLRVYAMSRGEILPSTEFEGRKGVYLPADLYDDVAFFDGVRYRVGREPGFSYRTVVPEYLQRRELRAAERAGPPVFVPYQGSEGYSPVAYAPHIAAAMLARLLGLDFLATLYLMRLAGLAVMTAIAAYAITVTRHLRWAFLLIAMLPTALYGRSVVGGDGAALSIALVITALCLNAATRQGGGTTEDRSLWMTLCLLSKPPHIVFALLEAMTGPLKELPRRWRTLGLVVLPGLVLSPAWILAVSADMAAWRVIEGSGLPAHQFDPVWKLGFMLENPLHFPRIVVVSLREAAGEWWLQLVGVLGWLDVWLGLWAHGLLTLALLLVPLEALNVDRRTRLRIAAFAGLVTAAYVLAVFLIFFLAWTPTTVPHVWGVQGRYFIVVLPVAAVLLAAICNVRVRNSAIVIAAISGALVSGVATMEALWRVHW